MESCCMLVFSHASDHNLTAGKQQQGVHYATRKGLIRLRRRTSQPTNTNLMNNPER